VIIKSKFSPRWWLRNPHLQTIAAAKLFQPPKVDSQRERLELNDGDFLDINWSHKTTGPLVCLFHGLAGSIQSSYARGAFHLLEQAGMRPVFMHWRGCGGEPNRLARSYHSGETGDIATLIQIASERFPHERVYAIGYSLGANALLKYVGETSDAGALSGAIAVCPPLVLSVGADKLNTGVTRGYQRHLLSLMRQQHESKRNQFPHLNLPIASEELVNFWLFDDKLTAPLHGFENVHDYYTKCSARQYLKNITTNTHIVYALDDPFFTEAVLPNEHELSEHVTLELSDYGGHVGFIGDRTAFRWIDQHVCNLVRQFDSTAQNR